MTKVPELLLVVVIGGRGVTLSCTPPTSKKHFLCSEESQKALPLYGKKFFCLRPEKVIFFYRPKEVFFFRQEEVVFLSAGGSGFSYFAITFDIYDTAKPYLEYKLPNCFSINKTEKYRLDSCFLTIIIFFTFFPWITSTASDKRWARFKEKTFLVCAIEGEEITAFGTLAVLQTMVVAFWILQSG